MLSELPGLPFWSFYLKVAPFPHPFSGLKEGSVLLTLAGPGLGGRVVRSCSVVWEPSRCGGRGGWLRLSRPRDSLSREPLMLPVGRACRSLGPVLGLLAPSLGLSPSGRVVAAVIAMVPFDLRGAAMAMSVMES